MKVPGIFITIYLNAIKTQIMANGGQQEATNIYRSMTTARANSKTRHRYGAGGRMQAPGPNPSLHPYSHCPQTKMIFTCLNGCENLDKNFKKFKF